MIVVIVAEQDERDRRQIVERNCRVADALWAKPVERPGPSRVHRIGQERFALGLNQPRRMADEREDRRRAIERRWTPRGHGQTRWPLGARRAEQSRKRGERLAGGTCRIEESGAIEVITFLHRLLLYASSSLCYSFNDISVPLKRADG